MAAHAVDRACVLGLPGIGARALLVLCAAGLLHAQTGANILLVVNRNDPASRQVADYYRARRAVPAANVCSIDAPTGETIYWPAYIDRIETPVANCLKKAGLEEKVLYIVLTQGVPLRIDGKGGTLQTSEHSSVDSDLTLLYAKLKGRQFPQAGAIPNPYFGKRDMPFRHPMVPLYLVTRLAAYDVAEVKGMIDRSLAARNRGKFVIDAGAGGADGNNWLRSAAMLLPPDRVVFDDTPAILQNEQDVIGYASWGSNDDGRKSRWTGFHWLPGAIATEFVSSNARTLKRPPDTWNITTFQDREHFWGESPQSLSADYIHEGVTGVSGNVFEPYLAGCVRPEYLLPAYAQGRNLAESYYLAMPFLSWQGVVFGDPLCSLGKP
jgi:uncharacterized protein (TIGR03790 family)